MTVATLNKTVGDFRRSIGQGSRSPSDGDHKTRRLEQRGDAAARQRIDPYLTAETQRTQRFAEKEQHLKVSPSTQKARSSPKTFSAIRVIRVKGFRAQTQSHRERNDRRETAEAAVSNLHWGHIFTFDICPKGSAGSTARQSPIMQNAKM